jgi:hypothetical protein
MSAPSLTSWQRVELKYSGRPPWWMTELAQRLGRKRVGYSKYVSAMGLDTRESRSWLDELGVPS